MMRSRKPQCPFRPSRLVRIGTSALTPESRPRGGRKLLTSHVSIAAIATVLLATACGDATEKTTDAEPKAQTELGGAVRTPAPDVSQLSLPELTNDGKPMSFVAQPGELLVLYFGYTSCPDVCPTTLADLKAALKKLGEPASKVQLAMATIDPRRDTADVLPQYVQSFIPGSKALRTENEADLKKVAEVLGLSYEVDYSDPQKPEVAHSGYLYAVNDEGKLVVQWAFGTTSADMASDMKILLDQGSGS